MIAQKCKIKAPSRKFSFGIRFKQNKKWRDINIFARKKGFLSYSVKYRFLIIFFLFFKYFFKSNALRYSEFLFILAMESHHRFVCECQYKYIYLHAILKEVLHTMLFLKQCYIIFDLLYEYSFIFFTNLLSI